MMDPVAFFKDEFYNSADSPAERIEVLQNVCVVADCLEPEGVRTRLVPLLHEMAKLSNLRTVNDEVLHTLAVQSFEVAGYVGEGELHCLLPLLETLMSHDETVVRDAALDATTRIVAEKCTTEAQQTAFAADHLLPMVLRLASAGDPETFPGRASAAALIPRIYKYSNESNRTELRTTYLNLLRDEIPVVRRSASSHLAELVEASGSTDITHFMPCLAECWKDVPQRETTRIHAVDAISIYCKYLDESSVMKHLVPFLRQAVNDQSWRVRLAAVERLEKIIDNTGAKILGETLTGWMTSLLMDAETEVQSSCVRTLVKCLDALPNQAVEMRIFPILEGTIINSSSVSARASLAQGIGAIAAKLPRNVVTARAVPLMEKLLDDKVREVRCNTVPQICDFCEILGPTAALEQLFPSLSAIVTDRQWRVRLVLVKQLPRIGELLGPKIFFGSQWERILFQSLVDGASAVRDATLEAIVKMGSAFGEQEVSRRLTTSIVELFDESFRKFEGSRQSDLASPDNSGRSPQAYTLRSTFLHAIRKLAVIAPKSDIQDIFIPRLLQTASNEIPNLRFLTLSILGSLVKENKIERTLVKEKLLPLMVQAKQEDLDPDVRYFAAVNSEVCSAWLEA